MCIARKAKVLKLSRPTMCHIPVKHFSQAAAPKALADYDQEVAAELMQSVDME